MHIGLGVTGCWLLVGWGSIVRRQALTVGFEFICSMLVVTTKSGCGSDALSRRRMRVCVGNVVVYKYDPELTRRMNLNVALCLQRFTWAVNPAGNIKMSIFKSPCVHRE
jgi:hypothetical protein